jgi:5-hydroxyisourate hydrolase-like protein (transthyretin family)
MRDHRGSRSATLAGPRRRGRHVNTAVLLAVSVFVLTLAVAIGGAPAKATGTCTLAGTVTLSGGALGAGMGIHLWLRDGTGWTHGPYATADALGVYSVTGLEAGSYAVEFSDLSSASAYATQYYSGKYGRTDADLVTLADGESRTDINVTMSLAGHITGTVTDASAVPLAGININVFHSAGASWDNVAQATTGAGGSYDVGRLEPGVYRVKFLADSSAYLDQYYDAKQSLATADDVVVTAGGTTPNISATLAAPGRITGTVRNAAAAGLPGIQVSAYGPGGPGGWPGVWPYATTAADGGYAFEGLTAGSYRLEFRDPTYAYFVQFFHDKPDLATADDVAVTAGATRSGVDVTLVAPAHITGTVKNVADVGLAAISVNVYCLDGSGDWTPFASVNSGPGGAYDVGNLTGGTYRVGFQDGSYNYVGQFFSGKPDVGSADDVVVGAGATAPGIDATLTAAGRITGTVKDAGAAGLAGIWVIPYRSNGLGGWQQAGGVHTAADGTYSLGGLSAGTYRVSFSDPTHGLYVTQYYNNKTVYQQADVIVVGAGATTAGIDATLVAEPALSSGSTYAFAADATSGWHNTDQTVTIAAAGGTGPRKIHYSIDGGVTWTLAPGDSAEAAVSAEGSHQFEYFASDTLTTEATHDAGYVNIDKTKPSTSAKPASVKHDKKVILKFSVADAVPGCGQAAVKIQIKKGAKVVKTVIVGTRATNVPLTYKYKVTLKKGAYTWRVLATDVAGNKATKMGSAKLTVT